MTTTQYIGARYVPKFADPAEWDSSNKYESLTIVLNEGNSYTSRQDVPEGVSLDNNAYWLCTGNYNAQVEAYRKEVSAIKNAIQGYINVEAMKDSGASVNSIVSTAGFYKAGDGGGANYIVAQSSGNTPNGMDIIQLNNGNVAVLLVEGELKLSQVGCSVNLSDCSANINRAFKLTNSVLIDSASYFISSPIYIENDEFTFRGVGKSVIIANNNFPVDSYMLNVKAVNSHFRIADFTLYASNTKSKGIYIYKPYDHCIIENIEGGDMGNTFITAGSETLTDVGQSLLINNCHFYGPVDYPLVNPVFELIKQQELIMTNCKTMIRDGAQSTVPVLKMINTNNCLVQGNSFGGVDSSSESVIYVKGASSYNNRFISNYFENTSCKYAAIVDLDDFSSRSLTVFAFNTYYYNAINKYNFINAANVMLIGEDEEPDFSKTRVFIISDYANGSFTNPEGLSYIYADGYIMRTKSVSMSNGIGTKEYTISTNTSADADYGLNITDSVNNVYTFAYGKLISPNGFSCTNPGGTITLKDDNGVEHNIKVSTDGTLVVN